MPGRSNMAGVLFAVVKRAIDQEDPEGLLRMGAPQDEYDQETAKISARISSRGRSVAQIEAIIEEVWREQFTNFVNEKPDAYRPVFQRLARAIVTGLTAEITRR